MCSTWGTGHARSLLRAGCGCASAGSHGKLMVEGVVEFIGSTIQDYSAYINHEEGASLTKVALGNPGVRGHLGRDPETFERTWALVWDGRVGRSANYCVTFVGIRSKRGIVCAYPRIPLRPDPA